jgi:cytochrome c oxidase subunit III
MNGHSYPMTDPRHADRGATAPPEVGQLGMWIFIGTEVLFFGGLLLSYLYGRSHWPDGFAAASRHTHVWIGTINTGILLTSSACIALAGAASECAPMRRWTSRLLWLTALLGLAFMVLKGIEYTKEWHEHLFPKAGFAIEAPGAELFFWLYWFMTGIHALHLAIGIGAVSLFAWAAGRERRWADSHRIEVLALYWHFVDVIWIFLYPLLYLIDRHSS